MLYGLGKMHDSYFADRLERVVLMAHCIYVENTYEGVVAGYLPFYENGIYKYGGKGWTESQEKICATMGEEMCAGYK